MIYLYILIYLIAGSVFAGIRSSFEDSGSGDIDLLNVLLFMFLYPMILTFALTAITVDRVRGL